MSGKLKTYKIAIFEKFPYFWVDDIADFRLVSQDSALVTKWVGNRNMLRLYYMQAVTAFYRYLAQSDMVIKVGYVYFLLDMYESWVLCRGLEARPRCEWKYLLTDSEAFIEIEGEIYN